MAYFQVNKKPRLTFPTLTGSIVTFNSQYAGLPLKSHKIALTATQSGSGTPSPSNPRPISGWGAIHIGNISDDTNISYFQGVLNGTYGFVDLGSLSWATATYSSNRLFYANLPRRSIRLTANVLCFKYVTTHIYWAQAPNKSIGVIIDDDYTVGIIDDSYTDAPTFKTAMSGVYLIYELATPTTPSFTSAEFETLCEAFGMNGQSFTIQIGSTVYGGEYDARTGVLTVTHIYLHITTVNVANSKQAYVGVGGNKTIAVQIDQNELMCNILKPETFSFAYDNHIHFSNVQTLYLYMADEIGTTVAEWETWLVNNPLYICYKLATPTTIQLPPCPIDTLEGVNNIWADTGDTTLQYPKFG